MRLRIWHCQWSVASATDLGDLEFFFNGFNPRGGKS